MGGTEEKKPEKLGKYRVVEEVGQGGMATVYKARDEVLGKTVAVKVLRPELTEGEQYLERFKREAQIVASLEHSNIVSVFDYGCQDGLYYFVMTYIEGVSVYDLVCKNGRLPLSDGVKVCLDILSALDYAHGRDVIHRDLKPENFMISKEGVTYLADFGIARPMYGSKLTRISQRVGTPIYMSPEQVKGGSLDARSDIYAVGIALYEMLTGRLPFSGKDDVEIGRQHVAVAPPKPRSVNPLIASALELVILKSLEKEPRKRYQRAADMASALRSAANATSMSIPDRADPNTMHLRLEVIKVPETEVVAEPPAQAKTVDEYLDDFEGKDSLSRGRREFILGVSMLLTTLFFFYFYSRSVSLLSLTTIPTGAEVEEEGILWSGSTPFVMERTLVGKRTVRISKPGYEPLELELEVEPWRLCLENVVLKAE